MTHKPEIGGGGASMEPLPEGTYAAVIVGYEVVEKPEQFIEADKKEWAKKFEAEGKDVPPFPEHKKFQYQFEAKVAEGEHKGRWLPRKRTTTILSSHERNGLFGFLRKIGGIEGKHDGLKERIDAKDAPDFDTEVVGKMLTYDVEHNAKGYCRIENVRKYSGKLDGLALLAEFATGGSVRPEDTIGDEECPF